MEETIKTLSDYVKKVSLLSNRFGLTNSTTTPWFRGQAEANWDLIPGLHRTKGLIGYERDLIRDFKLLSHRILQSEKPENEFDWLYLMQHYELPTRLLDWTESAMIALFFCVENFKNEKDGAVIVLSPRVLNSLVLINTNTVPTSNYKELKDYIIQNPDLAEREVKANYPIAIRPPKNSARILAQRGVFTIHGKEPVCLYKLIQQLNINNYPVVDKIIIDGKSKKSLLKELYMNGISHSVIFPELVGIANELKNRYSIDFLGRDNWEFPFETN